MTFDDLKTVHDDLTRAHEAVRRARDEYLAEHCPLKLGDIVVSPDNADVHANKRCKVDSLLAR